MTPALRHVTKISSLSPKEIKGVLKLALEMKARPADYWDALKRRTLLMFFEKPSLRTRVSLEAGIPRHSLQRYSLQELLTDDSRASPTCGHAQLWAAWAAWASST